MKKPAKGAGGQQAPDSAIVDGVLDSPEAQGLEDEAAESAFLDAFGEEEGGPGPTGEPTGINLNDGIDGERRDDGTIHGDEGGDLGTPTPAGEEGAEGAAAVAEGAEGGEGGDGSAQQVAAGQGDGSGTEAGGDGDAGSGGDSEQQTAGDGGDGQPAPDAGGGDQAAADAGGTDPLVAAQAENEELRRTIRGLQGQFGTLNGQLRELMTKQAAADTPVAVRPDPAAIAAAISSNEELNKLKQEFPDFAEALTSVMTSVAEQMVVPAPAGDQQQGQPQPTGMTEEQARQVFRDEIMINDLNREITGAGSTVDAFDQWLIGLPHAQAGNFKAAYDAGDAKTKSDLVQTYITTLSHADAVEVLQDPAFQGWVDDQPRAVRDLLQSDYATSVIELLDKYKAATKQPGGGEQVDNVPGKQDDPAPTSGNASEASKRRAQLKSNVPATESRSSGAQNQVPSAEAAFQRAYNDT